MAVLYSFNVYHIFTLYLLTISSFISDLPSGSVFFLPELYPVEFPVFVYQKMSLSHPCSQKIIHHIWNSEVTVIFYHHVEYFIPLYFSFPHQSWGISCSFERYLMYFSLKRKTHIFSLSLVFSSFTKMCQSCGVPIYLEFLRFVGFPESVGYYLINFGKFSPLSLFLPHSVSSPFVNLIRYILYILILSSSSLNLLYFSFFFFCFFLNSFYRSLISLYLISGETHWILLLIVNFVHF